MLEILNRNKSNFWSNSDILEVSERLMMRWKKCLNFRANRRGVLTEVKMLTRSTADQKRAVTPIPERLAALESWNWY